MKFDVGLKRKESPQGHYDEFAQVIFKRNLEIASLPLVARNDRDGDDARRHSSI